MNQWPNESSCSGIGLSSSSSLYRDDKNNNSAYNNPRGKDEVIDVHVAGGNRDISNSDSAGGGGGWTNPHGILNGTRAASATFPSCTRNTNITARMNGIRNDGISSNGKIATTSSSQGTKNINSFSAVVGTARRANEKSLVQVVTTCSGDGVVAEEVKGPFAFETCAAAAANNFTASSKPGTTSNDSPFQNNWHPHLPSCSFQSSSSPALRNNTNTTNDTAAATSSHEVPNINASSASLTSPYSLHENSGGINGGGGGFPKKFGCGSSGSSTKFDGDDNRSTMDNRSSYNRRENGHTLSNSGYIPANSTMAMMAPRNANLAVGRHHHQQHRPGSHVNIANCNNINLNTNTSSNPYFPRPSPLVEINSYHENQHCRKGGVGVETSSTVSMKALPQHHYPPHQHDHHEQSTHQQHNNHYFNYNQQQQQSQRKRSVRAHSVITINLTLRLSI